MDSIAALLSMDVPLITAALVVLIAVALTAAIQRRRASRNVNDSDSAFSKEMLRLKRRNNDLESKLSRARSEVERARRR
ncbi:MAG: hypothetical protein AAGJ96_00540 [Pseudomonadota bacterium]